MGETMSEGEFCNWGNARSARYAPRWTLRAAQYRAVIRPAGRPEMGFAWRVTRDPSALDDGYELAFGQTATRAEALQRCHTLLDALTTCAGCGAPWASDTTRFCFDCDDAARVAPKGSAR